MALKEEASDLGDGEEVARCWEARYRKLNMLEGVNVYIYMTIYVIYCVMRSYHKCMFPFHTWISSSIGIFCGKDPWVFEVL